MYIYIDNIHIYKTSTFKHKIKATTNVKKFVLIFFAQKKGPKKSCN